MADECDPSPPPSLFHPFFPHADIFDGDELSAAELKVETIETAQYSCHVVGLVLSGTGKDAFICDPNGALLAGGNMEFLSLPLAPSGFRPTTAVSAWDRDQAAAQKKPKSKK